MPSAWLDDVSNFAVEPPLAERMASFSRQAAWFPVRRRLVHPVRPRLIEPNWVMMAPVIAVTVLINLIATLAWPNLHAAAGWLVAAAIAAATPWLVKVERAKGLSATAQNALGTFTVALPMLLVGLSAAHWASDSGMHWKGTVGSLVIIGAMASMILKRRAPSMINAQVALWSGVAMGMNSQPIWFALTLGAAIGIYTAMRQARADQRAARRQREREHE